jgi:uncharacterized YigZ family protein
MVDIKHSFVHVSTEAHAILVEKSSKFYASAYYFEEANRLKYFLDKTKANHPKASHYCFAYILDSGTFRANDDGEPSGTAGKPILNAILAKKLNYTLVIVARYFGGTLLGVPGLIHSYHGSAMLVLGQANIIEKFYCKKYLISYSFDQIQAVQKIIKQFNINILHQDFTNIFVLTVEVKTIDQLAFLTAIKQHFQIEVTLLA